MNLSNLSFSALPPINIPFRFFLTASLFIIIASIFLFFNGEMVWHNRWHPHTIMLVHVFTLGFISMIMMGAIIQILPVVGGVGIAKAKAVGTTCHLLHTIGTCLLLFSLGSSYVLIKQLTIIIFAISFSVYIVSVGLVLIKKLSQGATIIGIRLAIIALLITATLGLLLISQMIGLNFIPTDKTFTNLHLLWGMGWISLLIISVSFQVVPMFHVTPSFPAWLTKWLPGCLFTMLCLLLVVASYFPINQSIMLMVMLVHCVFAFQLLKNLNQRKRKLADTTVKFWQLSAFSLFTITILLLTPAAMLPSLLQSKLTMIVAAIFIFFYVVSILLGMIMKIMPFLSYTHLQQRCLSDFSAMQHLPNMHDFISKKQSLWLYLLHLLTGSLLLCTIIAPKLNSLLSLSLIIEFSWLFYLMIQTCLTYARTVKKMNAAPNMTTLGS